MSYYNTNNRNQIPGLSKIYEDYFGQKTDGMVVDVGAHDGYTWSNSWPLITAGWSGLLIEPHPGYCQKIQKLYAGRDNIEIIPVAASNERGFTKLYEAGSLTTLKTEMIEAYEVVPFAKGHTTGKVLEVQTEYLDNILKEVDMKPGFEVFTLDCEGSEEDVLEKFDVGYWKPKMILVEALEHHEYRAELDMKKGMFYKYCDDLFFEHGYKKIFSDEVNNVYAL